MRLSDIDKYIEHLECLVDDLRAENNRLIEKEIKALNKSIKHNGTMMVHLLEATIGQSITEEGS